MTVLYWNICGKGNMPLVLLHGWGMNAEVWQGVVSLLSPHFCLHLVDLPGYGRSQQVGALSLVETAQYLLPYLPPHALLLGWSLGGLVATELALCAPQQIRGLISVASSPCFTARNTWPGIKPNTLEIFRTQLSNDFYRTIERFLVLQTLGTDSAREDTCILKEVVRVQPMLSVEVLEGGLAILRDVDLRDRLPQITVPFLRLYGALDSLVPRRIAAQLDAVLTTSPPSIMMEKAAHAPFISHPDVFVKHILNFHKQLCS
ncbi:pimeloyl-ACP methyl ester esterase BioH [Pantoea sp. Nvir]|uniref:pimeloyl-ACP methyl ester esterase BioH n=1 Tax=Pantoea sp. Nvir TaxID=2576760 RepID=UPI00135B9A61|nr:pimeloyl-ACP methyl ester esterase BioH [Pantoea sp. Nvir]MXP66934.1 pimeloyl-ACP methyl ester esterase BioH [Pantoea sp. Nvir]